VAMHLWFLAVYLIVVSLTPTAIAAQRRWGLLVPTALAIAVAAVDAARYAGHVPYVGWLTYLFCWAALYQLGIAWQKGLLAAARPVILAAGSTGALALLLWLGPYPVSMIGVPGQAVQNTEPPSLAMLAFGCAQAGLVISLAPTLNRALRGRAVQRLLARANSNVMALYLWHMIPVVIVAIVGYPAGLLPQPVEGSADWWLARLAWVLVLSLVTAVELTLLWWGRRIFAAPLPSVNVLRGRWAESITLAGAGLARRVERGQRRIVIRLLGDLGHQLRVRDVAVGADHDDGPGEQSGEGAIGDRDAVVLTEVVAERRGGLHVLDALGAAEARLRERQVLGHVDHGKTTGSGALVEGAHAGGTDGCVHRRKDIQQHWLTVELVAADRAQIGSGQLKVGGRTSDGGQLTHGVDRVSTHSYLCHGHSLPSSARRHRGGASDPPCGESCGLPCGR